MNALIGWLLVALPIESKFEIPSSWDGSMSHLRLPWGNNKHYFLTVNMHYFLNYNMDNLIMQSDSLLAIVQTFLIIPLCTICFVSTRGLIYHLLLWIHGIGMFEIWVARDETGSWIRSKKMHHLDKIDSNEWFQDTYIWCYLPIWKWPFLSIIFW